MIPQSQQCPTMTVAEVAGLLGYAEHTFRRVRAKLEDRDGLPPRLPGGRYSRASFTRWLETYADRRTHAQKAEEAPVRISFDRARLADRYARASA